MKTESFSTLKIHKLTQEQYERELEAGRIDESAIYLTPDKEIDLSSYAIKDEVVDLTSDQTISGSKTFSEGITIGNATLTYNSENGRLVISVK